MRRLQARNYWLVPISTREEEHLADTTTRADVMSRIAIGEIKDSGRLDAEGQHEGSKNGRARKIAIPLGALQRHA